MQLFKVVRNLFLLFIFISLLSFNSDAQEQTEIMGDFINAEDTKGLVNPTSNPLAILLGITLTGGPFKPGDTVFFTAQERARADCNSVDKTAALSVRFIQPDNTFYVFSSPSGAKASWVILKEGKLSKGQSLSSGYNFIVPVDAKEGSWSIVSELWCKSKETGIYNQLHELPSFTQFEVTRSDLICVAGNYGDTYCKGQPGSGSEQWVRDRYTGRETIAGICELQTITLNTCNTDQDCTNQLGCVKKGETGLIVGGNGDGDGDGDSDGNGAAMGKISIISIALVIGGILIGVFLNPYGYLLSAAGLLLFVLKFRGFF